MKHTKKNLNCNLIFYFVLIHFAFQAQTNWEVSIEERLSAIIKQHKAFVSIPNLPENTNLMLKNINWVADNYKTLGFKVNLLETPTLPVLLLEKEYQSEFKTLLFYFHIDGQPVDPKTWDQADPFTPVLKAKDPNGEWATLDWSVLNETIEDEWRMFGRAAADDKAPIIMLMNALKLMQDANMQPNFNIKIIFDPEEEYGSEAFLSTINTYKERYAADAMIIMDGPAHESNRPTLTFGCRGIATCTITTYGAKLPQHSGHYGNYVPNPVFSLANILSSMKDDTGKVLIQHFYDGITVSAEEKETLDAVPDDSDALNKRLGIAQAEGVAGSYQEALQYPTLNVRQIETSWKGAQPKTVIPEFATASIDVRLVVETDGKVQLDKVKAHIENLGYRILDRDPTDQERLDYSKLVKFTRSDGINAFRTDLNSGLGKALRTSLTDAFGQAPISIRTMGGTVPIISAINTLNIPAIIVPTVNMDNNQHSPNENIRIGNIKDGIRICIAILQSAI